MSNANIVVTGANGTIGGRVVTELLGRKHRVVAVVRDEEKAGALKAAGAKVVRATFEDTASLRAAFSEADTVVLITANNANAAEQAAAAIAAAREAGVRKVVRISALKADVNGPTENTRQHGRTEALLRESGLVSVILRPHFFMQNALASLGSIAAEGKIYFGVGEGRLGMIDTRDVADSAVVAATSSAFDGQTIELTGPASIGYDVVAAAASKALGRPVAYVAVPPAAVAEAMRSFGADDFSAGIVKDYCTAYAGGWGDFTTREVERLTGKPPRSIDDFVGEVLVSATR
jgi:uncharacterized protein YbjT (DUF2867 family)